MTKVEQHHPSVQAVAQRYQALDASTRSGRLSLGEAISRYAWVTKDGRGLGLAHLDGAQTHLADDKTYSIPFVLSVQEEDRDGDICISRGCILDDFRHNPVVFFGHQQHPYPIARSVAPTGELTVYPEDRRIRGVPYFDSHDEDAMFVYGKCKRGFLGACSIAFVPVEAYKRDQLEKEYGSRYGPNNVELAVPHKERPFTPVGWLFKRYLLTEYSIVGVPSCAGAIRDALDAEKSFISPRLQKALTPYAAVAKGCWQGWCPPCGEVQKSVRWKKTGSGWESEDGRFSIRQAGRSRTWYVRDSKTGKETGQQTAQDAKEQAEVWLRQEGKSLKACTCNDCKQGKPCPCEKATAAVSGVPSSTQADMEPMNQTPGARTGQMATTGPIYRCAKCKGAGCPSCDSVGYTTKGQPSDEISSAKACLILRDGEVNGQPLTDAQRGMFGAACGRSKAFWKNIRKEGHGADSVSKDAATGAGVRGTGLSETSGTAGGYTVPPQNDYPDPESALQTEGRVRCSTCDGSGNCFSCHGEGMHVDHSSGAQVVCNVCSGSGDCADCAGSGYLKKPTPGSKSMSRPPPSSTKQAPPAGGPPLTMGPPPSAPMGKAGPPAATPDLQQPFNFHPAAQVSAALHNHLKEADRYLGDQLAGMDHPGMQGHLAKMSGYFQKGMEHTRAGVAQHFPDHDWEKMCKALEQDEGEDDTPAPGEAGAVDAGKVPPEADLGADLSGDTGQPPVGGDVTPIMADDFGPASASAGGATPFAGEETPQEELAEHGMFAGTNSPPMMPGTSSPTAVPGLTSAGSYASAPPAVNPALDTDTEEILQRYRTPKGWQTRSLGHLRRTKDGRAYLVVHKDLTDKGNPAELEPGKHGANEGQFIVGSGKVDWGKAKSWHDAIRKAAFDLDVVAKELDDMGKFQADQGGQTEGTPLSDKGKRQADQGSETGGSPLDDGLPSTTGGDNVKPGQHGPDEGQIITGTGHVDFNKGVSPVLVERWASFEKRMAQLGLRVDATN